MTPILRPLSPAARHSHGVESVKAPAAGDPSSLQDIDPEPRLYLVQPAAHDPPIAQKSAEPGAEAAIISFIAAEHFPEIQDYPLSPEMFFVEHWGVVYRAAQYLSAQASVPCIFSINATIERFYLPQFQRSMGGETVNWKTWPALALEEGGPVLSALCVRSSMDSVLHCYQEREDHKIREELHDYSISREEANLRWDKLAGLNGQQLSQLDARAFNIHHLHERPVPTFSLKGQSISTPGNLTSIFSQAKAGKSAVVGAMIAAIMAPIGHKGDFLGWSAIPNKSQAAVVHFDTEQSPADHEQIILTALKRAELKEPPPWLRSYYLTDIELSSRYGFVLKELERALKQCKAIYCVLLDGVGDLIADTNNPPESNAFVANLHALAIKYATVIVCILHENPDSTGKGNVKMRGHLGSQLERKSESNIRLAKDKEEITTQSTGKSRHAAIAEAKGPRFTFDSEAGHHISVNTPVSDKIRITEADRSFVEEMFRPTEALGGMSWEACHQRIEKLEKLSRGGSRKRFDKYIAQKLITRNPNANEVYIHNIQA